MNEVLLDIIEQSEAVNEIDRNNCYRLSVTYLQQNHQLGRMNYRMLQNIQCKYQGRYVYD